jgi:membrane protein
VLFSVAPLAIVLVSIFGLVLQDADVRDAVVRAIVRGLPVTAAGRADVEEALASIATPASAAGLAGVLVFAWAASGMMTAVRQGLEAAMGVTESRPPARGKLVDLVLVVCAAVLVLVTVGLTLLGELAHRESAVVAEALGLRDGLPAAGASRAVAFGLSIVVVLLLYRFVPARGLRVRDGVAGAIVTALLLQAISFLSGWIYEKTTRLSVVYGSFTVGLVFLYSVYLYASALLFGAELAAAWARPPTEDRPPLGARLRYEALRGGIKRGLAFVRRTAGSAPDDLV